MTNDKAAAYRRDLVQHNEDVQQILASVSPETAAFIRQAYQTNLYPLDFVRERAEKLEAFRQEAFEAGKREGAAPPPPQGKSILVDRDAELLKELRVYLDTQVITSENIGDIRRSLFFPWDSAWNGWVRDETSERENKPSAVSQGEPQEPTP